MLLKRIVVWLMLFTFVFVRVPAFAQSAHDEGVAAGTAANPTISGLITTPSATAVVPGYTTTPPEAAYAKKSSFGADVDAKLAACVSTPSDPTCEALSNAIASANAPRPALGPGDPAVLAASRITRNPSTDLGSLAAYYSGCATTDVTSPPTTATRQCARYVGVGSQTCSDMLTVAIDRSASCSPGDWFAHAQSGSAGLDVQCRPDQPLEAQHFRVTAGGKAVAHFDIDMTQPVVSPQIVAVLGTRYSWMTGTEIKSAVWAADKSCVGSACTLTAMVADSIRESCSGSGKSGFTCTTEKPFVEALAACPGGTQSGDNLAVQQCTGSAASISCTTGYLDAKTCYAPGGGIAATDITGSFTSSYWGASSTRAVVGWAPNPAYGPIPQMKLSYVKPAATATTSDTWNNQCPTLASGGRCSVTTPPRCVDGPSTKVIDGVPVTRACWEYQSSLSCSGTTTADQCAPLVAAGCTPLSSSCARTDPATGLCEVFDEQYRCAVPGETTTTATHCPTDVFCMGTNCFNIRAARDADFGRTMSMLEAAREAGVYLDKDRLQVFEGESNRCRNKLLKNCCYANGTGAGMTNHGVFGVGTRLVYDILTNSENREFIKSGMSALLTGAGLTGTFTTYGFTIALHGTALPAGSRVLFASATPSGTSVVLAVDPWSLALSMVIYVALSTMSCNVDESRLALKEGARLCRTIGTYCSSCIRVLGKCIACIERTTSKCCFNSQLARIVNEQGRLQVGKGWGGSKDPDCSGFTVTQLQSLDFAAMDLSEFYASIVPESPHLGTLQTHNASRIPSCYFGQGKC